MRSSFKVSLSEVQQYPFSISSHFCGCIFSLSVKCYVNAALARNLHLFNIVSVNRRWLKSHLAVMEAAQLILGVKPNNKRCFYSLDGMLTAHPSREKHWGKILFSAGIISSSWIIEAKQIWTLLLIMWHIQALLLT